jgi:hypothetical protein
LVEVAMKAERWLALVLVSTLAVRAGTAEERIDGTAAPINRAITRESARLAAVPRGAEGRRVTAAEELGWSRVRKLEPGTEITVTAAGAASRTLYLLDADDSTITVLDLGGLTLAAPARSALQRLAASHPRHFTEPRASEAVRSDENVRLTSDGVFIADQKVAELERIVGRIPRSGVTSGVKGDRRPGSGWANRQPVATGALIGTAVGVVTAGAFVASLSPKSGPCRDCAAWVLGLSIPLGGLGAGTGAAVGALVGVDTVYPSL